MDDQLLFVFSNPVDGHEAEYDEWYDDHVAHLVGLDGFVSGQRYRLTTGMARDEPPYKYVVVYEVEGDGDAARNSMRSGLKDGSIVRSEAVDWAGMQGWFFEPMAEKVQAHS